MLPQYTFTLPNPFCIGAVMQLLQQIDVIYTKQPKFNIAVNYFGARHLASFKQVVGPKRSQRRHPANTCHLHRNETPYRKETPFSL